MNSNKNKTAARSDSAPKNIKKSATLKNLSVKKKLAKNSENKNGKKVESNINNSTISKTKRELSKSFRKEVGESTRSVSKEKAPLKTIKKKSENKDNYKPISPSEVKITKNVDTISRLINNSNDILAQQNSLLEKCEELTKKVTSSDFEIDRLLTKNESDDFPHFLDKYSSKLGGVLNKLRSHTNEVEEIKYVREENKNLKYKLELMSIDKSDSGLQFESKYNSLNNFIISEFNSFNEFLVDLGYDYLYHKFNYNNLQEEGINVYFQNLRKLLKNIKLRSNDTSNSLEMFNIERNNMQEEIRILKSKIEEMKLIQNRDISATENYNKTMEEDLYYYKNLVRDYERQLDDLKRSQERETSKDDYKGNLGMSSLKSGTLNTINTNTYNNGTNIRNDESRKYGNTITHNNYENPQYSQQHYQVNTNMNTIANNSLENFRRNKDLRVSNVSNMSNPFITEEQMRLENKYSDSSFYKSDYNQYGDYKSK